VLDVLRVIKASFGDVWEDVWTALVCTLLWVLSVILVIPMPPVTLALFYYANRRAHGEIADLKDFWAGLRGYWKAAYRWGFLNLAVLLLLALDYQFTGQLGGQAWVRYAQGLYLALGGVWILLQLYTLPFLLEQEKPSVREALRNAAVMLGKNPGFSALLFCMLAGLLLAGVLLFMVSVAAGGCFLAIAANRAVLNRLTRKRQSTALLS
jgi:uncharacterized membrane protein YesL